MWLLDKNLPIQLFLLLKELGVVAVTAEYQDWGGFTDSALVSAVIESGIVCILTRDRLFPQPGLAIVIVELPKLHREEFLSNFRDARTREPIQPVIGTVINWPRPASPAG